MILVLMQMIRVPDHALIYNFFTWLIWPVLFFIAGYYIKDKNLFTNSVLTVKYYLLPYVFIGILMIILNKIIQFFNLTRWFNTIFPSMKIGTLTLAYGNGTATNTIFGPTNFGVGLLWVLLALCFGTIVHLVIIKLKVKFFKVLISIGLMILGFYVGTMVRLPWSLDAALIMQPYLLLGHFFNDFKIENINGPVTIGVGILAVWAMSISNGPFDLMQASMRYWFLGTITAVLGLLMSLLVAMYVGRILSDSWCEWLIKLGNHQSINIALLACISLMMPIYNYVNTYISIPYVNFIMVWLIVLIIIVAIKLIIKIVVQYYLNNSKKEDAIK